MPFLFFEPLGLPLRLLVDFEVFGVDEFWETVRFDEGLFLLVVVFADPDFVACSFDIGGVVRA